MTTRRFLTTASIGLLAAAIALALAAREAWEWRGAGRQWLLAMTVLPKGCPATPIQDGRMKGQTPLRVG
jgi:hypothetical protein